MAFAATGDSAMKTRGDQIVDTLAEVQAAHGRLGDRGLLFPYSSEGFAYLFELQPYNRKYPHVPFYVMHKMLAGMLDQVSYMNSATLSPPMMLSRITTSTTGS
jgi:hypothetical protein